MRNPLGLENNQILDDEIHGRFNVHCNLIELSAFFPSHFGGMWSCVAMFVDKYHLDLIGMVAYCSHLILILTRLSGPFIKIFAVRARGKAICI